MPLQLALGHANGVVRQYTFFEGRKYSVGRDSSSDIVLAHPQVSRHHATFEAVNDQFWSVTDTSSTGCYEGGLPISTAYFDIPRTLSFGPVSCRIAPVSTRTLTKQDSVYYWRKRQLEKYQYAVSHCDTMLALVHLARECLMQTLQCERAALIIFDKDNGFQSGIGYEPWMDADGFSGSRTIIRRAIDEKAPVAIGNIQQDSTLNRQHSILQHGIRAALCVPVTVDDDIVGVLYGDNTQGRICFTETDTLVASALAQFLSLRLLFRHLEHKISLVTLS